MKIKSMKQEQPKTIDEYIATFPKDVQKILKSLRQAIKETAPEAQETISWRMPTFKLNDKLVFFAAFKKHIGLYPGPEAIVAFKEKLAIYKTSKGAIQFPINKPLPLELIKEIVDFRLKERQSGAKNNLE